MRLRKLIGVVAFLLPSLLLAQPTGPPISGGSATRVPPLTTVGSLPTCNAAASGKIVAVSDGATSTDCSTGSGSTVVVCYCNGTSWDAFAGLSGLGGVDNIVLRSDGTSGDTAQGSSVSLADGSGDMTAPGFTFITTEGTTTTAPGSAFTNQPANDKVEVLSSDAADITQTVTIIGTTNGTDTVVEETISLDALDGTTAVASIKADWGVILAVKISAITAGNITVREDSGDLEIVTITAGSLSAGVGTIATAQSYMANRAVRLVSDGATTKVIGLKGIAVNGTPQYDAQALSGTTAVESNSVFGTLTEIYTGDLEAARTATAYTNADVIVDPGGSADLYLASGDITAPGALTISTAASNGNIVLDPHGTGGFAIDSTDIRIVRSASPWPHWRLTDAAGTAPQVMTTKNIYATDITLFGSAFTGAPDYSAALNPTVQISSTTSPAYMAVNGSGYIAVADSGGAASGTKSRRLYAGDSGFFDQRNSTTAQGYRLYGTYTDASNYERLSLSTTAGAGVTIAAETAGTGADNLDIILDAAGTGTVQAPGQGTYADDHVQIGPGAVVNTTTDDQGGVAIGYTAKAINPTGVGGGAPVAIGGLAAAGGYSIAIGNRANAWVTGNAIAIGVTANSGVTPGTQSTCIGATTNCVGDYSIALGYGSGSTTKYDSSLAIGYLATTTAANQAVIGDGDQYYGNVYFNDVTDNDPNGIAINAAGGSGTNIAGASLTLAGGKGTGNAAGGSVKLQTSVAGASGTTLQTLTDVLSVKNDQATYIGDGGTTNYVKIASDGHVTMAGTATYWDDVLVPGAMLRDVGAAPADMAAWTGMSPMYAYHFEAASDEELFGSIQMPHSWAGTPIYFHVHWAPETVSDGNPANQQVRWCIDYTWAEYDTVFPAPTTATCGLGPDEEPVASKHYITAIGTLTPGTGADKGSSILYFRLYRDADHADDDYEHEAILLSIDGHFEANRLGSNTSTPD